MFFEITMQCSICLLRLASGNIIEQKKLGFQFAFLIKNNLVKLAPENKHTNKSKHCLVIFKLTNLAKDPDQDMKKLLKILRVFMKTMMCLQCVVIYLKWCYVRKGKTQIVIIMFTLTSYMHNLNYNEMLKFCPLNGSLFRLCASIGESFIFI